MSARENISWAEANQAYLVAEFALLRYRLGLDPEPPPNTILRQIRNSMESPSAIDTLSQLFELTIFEREILLLCAAVEMDSPLASRYGAGREQRVTFGLALEALTDPHWSALTPDRPLRRFHLVELAPGHGLTAAPLRIDERILHYLAGVNVLDPRLEPLLHIAPHPWWIAEEQAELAAEISRGPADEAAPHTAPDTAPPDTVPPDTVPPEDTRLEDTRPQAMPPHLMLRPDASLPLLLHLSGDDPRGQQDVAAVVAEHTSRRLYILRAEDIPAAAPDLDELVRLWSREAPLLGALLFIAVGDGALTPAARQLIERIPGPLILSGREPLRFHRSGMHHEVNKPQPAGQKRLWQRALNAATNAAPADTSDVASPTASAARPSASQPSTAAEQRLPLVSPAQVDDLAAQFRLSAETIFSVAARAAADLNSAQQPARNSARHSGQNSARQSADDSILAFASLWSLCRSLSRPRLDDLARRIVASAEWDDLILPTLQKDALRQLAAQARHRMQVYESWGFAARGRRGLGITALFTGASGTGKTLAAEVLARQLRLDLYRIDLSAVVSKYIGETEKNLKQLFDAAEEGGVILLFDEADALFGKRAEVKDSHDRYANIEVGYLLQRMEAYQGLAILTTNLASSMDRAFQRRLRFSIDFPFPDAAQRQAIWTGIFPPQTPVEDLDSARLAQLNMTGGSIRNIALNAAFLAAESGQPVRMEHLLKATRWEGVKTDHPLSPAETRGWS
jgi:hypothetical protein